MFLYIRDKATGHFYSNIRWNGNSDPKVYYEETPAYYFLSKRAVKNFLTDISGIWRMPAFIQEHKTAIQRLAGNCSEIKEHQYKVKFFEYITEMAFQPTDYPMKAVFPIPDTWEVVFRNDESFTPTNLVPSKFIEEEMEKRRVTIRYGIAISELFESIRTYISLYTCVGVFVPTKEILYNGSADGYRDDIVQIVKQIEGPSLPFSVKRNGSAIAFRSDPQAIQCRLAYTGKFKMNIIPIADIIAASKDENEWQSGF